MDLLLRDATLVTPDAPPRRTDVRVRDGRIDALGDRILDEAMPTLDLGGALVSAGWFDLYARLGEPGLEHRETMATGLAAAAAGGFTAVGVAPETEPPVDTREGVAFVRSQAAGWGVEALPVGSLTKRRAGSELAELHDLAEAGAVAFSDGRFVEDASLMRRGLEYAAMVDRPVLLLPHDARLAGKGMMHEGAAGTRAGVPGIPEAAETSALARDLLLAEATGARVHVLHATTRRSLDLVREARARGVRVTASVSAHHLALTDADVEARAYHAGTKLLPPLRPETDRDAVVAALADGTLDAVVSDHAPFALHETEVEFAAAPFGASALETVWPLISTHAIAPGHVSIERAIDLLTDGPRRCLGLRPLRIEPGVEARLTVFDATTAWTFDAARMRSRSRHTAIDGDAVVGRVHRVVLPKGEVREWA